LYSVLWICNVYPGSRIRIFSIPDLGVKTTPDPGSGSVATHIRISYNIKESSRVADPVPNWIVDPAPGPYSESGSASGSRKAKMTQKSFLFSGHEPIYFIENKEKTLLASYDRGTQIFDYMD
jgi:hypothetical protein